MMEFFSPSFSLSANLSKKQSEAKNKPTAFVGSQITPTAPKPDTPSFLEITLVPLLEAAMRFCSLLPDHWGSADDCYATLEGWRDAAKDGTPLRDAYVVRTVEKFSHRLRGNFLDNSWARVLCAWSRGLGREGFVNELWDERGHTA